ncbi:MAG: hypothetical protein AAFU50_09880, partial [Pseudomonadota bacterium]
MQNSSAFDGPKGAAIDDRERSRLMFNEMQEADGATRQAYARIENWLKEAGPDLLRQRGLDAEAIFRRIGIT